MTDAQARAVLEAADCDLYPVGWYPDHPYVAANRHRGCIFGRGKTLGACAESGRRHCREAAEEAVLAVRRLGVKATFSEQMRDAVDRAAEAR